MILIFMSGNKIKKSIPPTFTINKNVGKGNKDIFLEFSEYTGIIIEPRKHKAIKFVLDNFMQNLDNKWNFIFFHGSDNINYVENIINEMPKNQQQRILLINMNIKNLSINDYNIILSNSDIYKFIPTEMFLIFQTDTMICNNNNNFIESFMLYDYVGAPWYNKSIGNGGLSLRRKSKMLEIIAEKSRRNGEPEDVYFGNCCKKTKLTKPDFEVAKTFSVENVASNHTFGIHKPWGTTFFGKTRRLNMLRPICPQLDLLISLQGVE